MDGEEICDARFSKCCGGITEEFQYCWEDTPKTYLTAVRDIALGVEHTLPNLTNEEEAEKWIRFNRPAFCNTQDKKILSEVLNDYDQETVNFYRWKETLSQEKLQQLIADKLKMPQTWKTTLALDWKMPLGFDNMFTLEGTYAKDFKALSIYDANIDMEKATAKRFEGPDNRYYYPGNVDMRIYPKIGYAYELKNTDKGYSANIMAQIKMRPLKNLDLMAAYTWTTAKSVNSLLSNQIENAVTNHHQVNGINFEQSSHPSYLHSPHRIIASAAYKVDYLDDNMSTRISVFYQGRKNGSYSYLYNGDMNNDGKGYDLIYIPASKDDKNIREERLTAARRDFAEKFAEKYEDFDVHIDVCLYKMQKKVVRTSNFPR